MGRRAAACPDRDAIPIVVSSPSCSPLNDSHVRRSVDSTGCSARIVSAQKVPWPWSGRSRGSLPGRSWDEPPALRPSGTRLGGPVASGPDDEGDTVIRPKHLRPARTHTLRLASRLAGLPDGRGGPHQVCREEARLAHRARAAFRAISRRCSGLKRLARVLPPFLPAAARKFRMALDGLFTPSILRDCQAPVKDLSRLLCAWVLSIY
jgi:hypothetical protein